MDPNLHSEALSKLVLLPRVSDELQALNPAIQGILGHGKTFNFLTNNNFKGILIRVTPHSNKLIFSQNVSYGCIYIPAPNFDRIIIIKNVSDLSRDDSVNQITHAVLHQVQKLHHVVSDEIKRDSGTTPEKVPVHLIVSLTGKIKKTANFKALKLSLQSSLLKSIDFSSGQLLINVEFLTENEMVSEIRRKIQISASISDTCCHVSQYYASFHLEGTYQLKKTAMRFLNSQPSTLDNVDKVTETFQFFFPKRLEMLYTVPELNQLSDNLLYYTNDEGELGHLSDYGAYMGEVVLFFQQLIRKLYYKSGVLLKSFTNRHLESIIDPAYIQPQNFEMDWIYLGSDKIVVFEVGLSENSRSSKTSIKNKINQCLTKIIPQMQLILYSIHKAFQQGKNFTWRLFQENFNEKLKVCIYFPQLSEDALWQNVEQLKHEMEATNQQISQLKQSADNFWNVSIQQRNFITDNLVFLVSCDSANSLKLKKIDANFEIVDCNESVESIFKSSAKSSDGNLFSYACSLFAVASLNYLDPVDCSARNNTALDVDERYFSSFEKWRKRKGILISDQFKFVLSPQQHRILREVDKTHLVITGQPGSGKTTLLLAKCEQMASWDEIDKFLFLYDIDKSVFRKQLERLIHASCSTILTNKLNILGITYGGEDPIDQIFQSFGVKSFEVAIVNFLS